MYVTICRSGSVIVDGEMGTTDNDMTNQEMLNDINEQLIDMGMEPNPDDTTSTCKLLFLLFSQLFARRDIFF